MEIKKSSIQMIVKSYLRKNKICKAMAALLLVCGLLVMSLAGMVCLNISVKTENSKAMYGEYQIGFEGLSAEKTEQIKQEKDCKSYVVYSENAFWKESEFTIIISSDESYLTLGAVQLTEGTFPSDGEEILCQREYIYRNGFSDENYLGQEVEVNGKTYKICGLIENNLTGDMSDTIINVFIRRMRTDETSFSMLINTGSLSYKSKMNRMIEKYNIKEHFENRAAIEQAEISNQGKLKDTNGFLVIMLLCVLVLVLFITYIMMRFYYMGLQKQMAIYEKIGISKKQRNTGYVVSVILILTVSGLIAFTGSAGVLSFLMQSYDAAGNMGLCLTGVAICGLLFIILNIVSAVIVTKRADQTKKKKTLENTSSRLDGDVNVYIYLAKKNRNMSRWKYIVMCLMVILSSIICVTTIYFMRLIRELQEVPKDYDYLVEFIQYQYYAEVQDEYNVKSFEQLKTAGGMTVFPSYVCYRSVKIDKVAIRGRFKEYLCENSSYNRMELEKNSHLKFDTQVVFIGVEESATKLLGLNPQTVENLADNECILVRQVRAFEGTGFDCGFQKNDEFTVSVKKDGLTETGDLIYEDLTVRVKDEIEELAFDFYDEDIYYKPIVLVNINTYKKLALKKYPMRVYIQPFDITEMELFSILGRNNNYTVKNLRQWNESVQEIINTYTVTSILTAVLFIGLVILNTIIMVCVNYHQLKNEITMLRVIGIRDNKASLVLTYHIIKMVLICLPAIFVCSVGTTFFVNLYMRGSITGLYYRIPWGLLGGILAVVFLSILSVILFITRFIGRKNIPGSLRQWNQ